MTSAKLPLPYTTRLPYRGPGCSSIGGGFMSELGPFFPTQDGRGLQVGAQQPPVWIGSSRNICALTSLLTSSCMLRAYCRGRLLVSTMLLI